MALDLGFVERDARRHAVDDAADRRPVAFAPGGESEEMAEAVGGHDLPTFTAARVTPTPSIRRRDRIIAYERVAIFRRHSGSRFAPEFDRNPARQTKIGRASWREKVGRSG